MQSFAKIVIAFAAAAGIVSAAPQGNLKARDMTGDLTFYTPGLGACGITNGEGDAVAALGWELFDQFTPNGNPNLNSLCGRRLQINLNGKSVIVAVEDRCVACQANDVDVPIAIFEQLAEASVGRTQITWNWV